MAFMLTIVFIQLIQSPLAHSIGHAVLDFFMQMSIVPWEDMLWAKSPYGLSIELNSSTILCIWYLSLHVPSSFIHL